MSSSQPVNTGQPLKKRPPNVVARLFLLALFGIGIWGTLFITEIVTVRGIPYSVLSKVMQDGTSRAALLARDSQALHDRLNAIGVEYDIKEYYSKKIDDPVELDQHIHQVFYNLTGYVGENYTVLGGRLVLKNYERVEELYLCPEC